MSSETRDGSGGAAHPAAAHLLGLALGTELLLAVLAVLWTGYRGISLRAGDGPWYGNASAGVLAAAAFAIGNYWLLRHAPPVPAVRAIRRLYRHTLRPLFAGAGPFEIAVIAVAAGIGEELLFRGALQPEVGLIPASLVFGALHMGGRGTLAFGCWVAVMGGLLGWLAVATGGLLAPIVAHALYDAAALVYIRCDRDGPAAEPGASRRV